MNVAVALLAYWEFPIDISQSIGGIHAPSTTKNEHLRVVNFWFKILWLDQAHRVKRFAASTFGTSVKLYFEVYERFMNESLKMLTIKRSHGAYTFSYTRNINRYPSPYILHTFLFKYTEKRS